MRPSLTPPSRRPRSALATALALAAAIPGGLTAQAIPAPDYVTYLPRDPLRPVAATDASATLALFGDRAASGYRDSAPRDGVDDRRGEALLALGLRFAPWMVRNVYGFPLDIGRLIREHDVPLVRDRFNLARHQPELVSSDSILAGRPVADCDAEPEGSDCRLLALYRDRGPQTEVIRGGVTPTEDRAEVLYFDMPGDSPRSWAAEYGGRRNAFEVAPGYLGYAKVYLHPFLARTDPATDGTSRYELVLQYWFYYAANDAGNVHEGDWEHINVVVARRDRVGEPLDSATVTSILADRFDREALVIGRVEYYFHHWVYPADYANPNVYLPRKEWERERDSLPATREGERQIRDAIRERAYLDADETQLNLHPVVYIGGDGRGLNLLLRAPGALGLSSHGSYPFPGLYKAVGPAATGESVMARDDIHRHAPPVEATEAERLVRFDRADRLQLVPDWERLADLALEEPAVRWEWAWLLLPAHDGYPASRSPFAGVVRYAETGNVGAIPPIYNGAWNRAGDAAGYAVFVPHRISSLFPLDVQDAFDARWGWLNATKIGAMLPPFDVLSRVIERPLARLLKRSVPTYARRADLPARRVGMGFGFTRVAPSTDFGNLLGFPELAGPIIQRGAEITGTPLLGYGLGAPTFDDLISWQAELDLYLGDHFVTSNALAHGRSTMRRDVVFNNFPDVPLRADLNFWEYTGSLRWNLRTGKVQPFVQAGYGLTWYRIEDLEGFGEDLGSSRWVRRPSLFHNLLPNTWHAGMGVELLPGYGFGKLNLGFKGTVDVRTHRLGLSTSDNTTVFFQDGRITRWVVGLVLTLAM